MGLRQRKHKIIPIIRQQDRTPVFTQQDNFIQSFFNWIFFVDEREVFAVPFFFQCLLYIGLIFMGIGAFDEIDFNKDPYDNNSMTKYFLHNINLVFHEAGHLIFRPLGDTMRVFGGSLMQCLMPLIVIIQFLRQRDNFGASVGLWWIGQNFLDVAPYIYDAWDKKLPLLGGIIGQENPNYHDWHNLLTKFNSMQYHDEIAFSVGYLGIFFICLSFIWAGVILYKRFLLIQSTGY